MSSYATIRLQYHLRNLNAERFKNITRVGDLEKVLRGITAAKNAGFENIKLNTVLMRGVNDDETIDLVRFAIEQEINISFIEEMPIGVVDHARDSSFVSNTETLATLQKHYPLISSELNTGGPARYWQVTDTNTKIGFISPHSHNFCEACNRVRITCKGELYLCLGQDDKIELMPILRAHPHDDEPLKNAIIESMKIKPKGHDFDLNRTEPAVVRFMSHTGG
jgi:cyclic pyranopterin phosphate synthase